MRRGWGRRSTSSGRRWSSPDDARRPVRLRASRSFAGLWLAPRLERLPEGVTLDLRSDLTLEALSWRRRRSRDFFRSRPDAAGEGGGLAAGRDLGRRRAAARRRSKAARGPANDFGSADRARRPVPILAGPDSWRARLAHLRRASGDVRSGRVGPGARARRSPAGRALSRERAPRRMAGVRADARSAPTVSSRRARRCARKMSPRCATGSCARRAARFSGQRLFAGFWRPRGAAPETSTKDRVKPQDSDINI